MYAARMHMAVLVLLYIAVARVSFLVKQEKLGGALLSGIAVYQLVDAALYTSMQYG